MKPVPVVRVGFGAGVGGGSGTVPAAWSSRSVGPGVGGGSGTVPVTCELLLLEAAHPIRLSSGFCKQLTFPNV